MESNSSLLNTATFLPYPAVVDEIAIHWRSNGFVTREMPTELAICKLRNFSVTRAFQGIPESAPERMPHLVMQQRVDGQGRALQQPRL